MEMHIFVRKIAFFKVQKIKKKVKNTLFNFILQNPTQKQDFIQA